MFEAAALDLEKFLELTEKRLSTLEELLGSAKVVSDELVLGLSFRETLDFMPLDREVPKLFAGSAVELARGPKGCWDAILQATNRQRENTKANTMRQLLSLKKVVGRNING